MTNDHLPTTCPRCGQNGVPVYELALPEIMPQSHCCGALHLAAHDCSNGGDHMQLQPQVDLRKHGTSPEWTRDEIAKAEARDAEKIDQ